MAAQGLHRSQTFLGDYFRRMKARLGTPKAMTAAAHKLARIVYHMIMTHQEYDTTVFQELEQRVQARKRMKLRAQARELGFDLVAREVVPQKSPTLRSGATSLPQISWRESEMTSVGRTNYVPLARLSTNFLPALFARRRFATSGLPHIRLSGGIDSGNVDLI